MKQKITLLMLAALFVAASSFAQGKANGRPLSKKNLEAAQQLAGKHAKQPSLQSLQRQNDPTVKRSARAAFAVNQKVNHKANASVAKKNRHAARRAADAITEQPAGTQVMYSRSGDAYYYYWGYIFSTSVSGAVGNVVFGANNKVYIKNIITQYSTNAWVEGTISGTTVTIQFPQKVMNYDGTDYYVNLGAFDDDFNFTPANGPLTLDYNAATGAITTPASSAFASGEQVVALVDDENYWAGYADWNINLEKVTDALVEAPAGLQTELYALTADGYSGSLVKVGFQGSDVYVQGIDSNLPDNWVKGTVNGNKVTFANGQYIGADEVTGYHQYLVSATASQEYDDYYQEYYTVYTLNNNDITFDYDAATKTLSNSTTFLVNAGKTDVNYLYAFDKASMAKFTEVAATPAKPVINEVYEGGWDYFSSGYGWGYIDADVKTADTEGNYILPEKLSYALWVRVNGEEKQLPLSSWDYMYQETETMDEIPFGYNDGWDIYASGSNQTVYYYVIGPEAYGVQAIYRGAGEEHRSDIAWMNISELGADVQPAAATPAYPEPAIAATDKSIGYGFYTGNEKVVATTNNYKPETYNVAIKLDAANLVGNYIESITFPLQEVEGVADLNVFLTSQLRVENGINVPDLTVKAVTPSAPGFITVTLDKPYLIPADGVYVGYSMTVNDVSSVEANATPITVVPAYNENGLYLHTSDGFLKWLDVAELFGASAMIQVKLTGANVKGSAVAVAEGEMLYVKTGDAFTVPVSLVNYGANGIQSVDIQYSVADKTGSQHFDLTVDGFYGKQAVAQLQLPAISQRGNYELVMRVDKVNGAANEESAESSTSVGVVAVNTLPKKRTLLEEYTGFWCGWCPRGFVALEKLAEQYPDRFVLVSYHNGDELEIMDSKSFPSEVPGFPDAWMDRAVELDAYYGSGNKDMGIVDDLNERNKTFGMADLTFSSTLNADAKTVDINTQVVFAADVADANYGVEYVLTADGLTDASWVQSNYYANGGAGYPAYMDEFTQTSTSSVTGLVYNDVAVLTSEQLGGSSNDITTATADVPVALTYQFQLADAVSTAGAPVIQDVNKVKIVALLVDRATGNVLNANKAKIGQQTTGISIAEAAATDIANVSYYDMAGRRVAKPAHGVFVKTVRYADGKSVTRKVVVK